MSTRRATLIAELRAFAQERGFALEMTQAGTASIPLHQGSMLATSVSAAVTTVRATGLIPSNASSWLRVQDSTVSRISGDLTR